MTRVHSRCCKTFKILSLLKHYKLIFSYLAFVFKYILQVSFTEPKSSENAEQLTSNQYNNDKFTMKCDIHCIDK